MKLRVEIILMLDTDGRTILYITDRINNNKSHAHILEVSSKEIPLSKDNGKLT